MTDLREYETWAKTKPYAARVDATKREIEKAARLGRMVISTSWGKDSIALLDVVIEVLGHVEAMHLASTYALPGSEHVKEHFAARCIVHEVPSAMPLAELVEWLQENGLGYERTRVRGAGKKRKASSGIGWAKEHGYTVQALGMRAEESNGRRTCFRVRGLTYPAHGLTITNPIGWWTVKDTWARIASRGLPYPSLYDKETHGETRETLRNSGWLTVPSAQVDSRVSWLRVHYPAQYEALVAAFPQTGLLG
mgnify:FL=1